MRYQIAREGHCYETAFDVYGKLSSHSHSQQHSKPILPVAIPRNRWTRRFAQIEWFPAIVLCLASGIKLYRDLVC